MKVFRLTCLCLLVAVSVLRAQDETRKLRIALDDWPPLEYVEYGVVKGINAEVISRIMTRLEIPFELQVYPFTRSWMMAERGKVDAVSSVSYQPFREDAVFYTDEQREFLSKGTYPSNYLWKGEYVFFLETSREASFRFSGYEDKAFENYKVGVVKTYSYNEEFRNADITRVTFATPQAALAALAEGKIDLVPLEHTAGAGIVKELGLGKKVTHCDPTIFSKPYYLTFTKKSSYPDLEEISIRFYAELAKMRATGEYDSIYESYIRPHYIQDIKRPLIFVCEEWIPLEYVHDNKVKGVDASVVAYIMKRLGVPYKIEIYPWSRAWMMAQKGKADAVLSVSYKESREPVLFFTEDQRTFGEKGTLPENYLWMSEYVFFVMKQSKDTIKFESYDQLKKDRIKIGRNRDYSYDPAFLAADFKGPVYSKTEDGILALVSGDIDLYPMDKTIGAAVLQELGLAESVSWLPKPLFSKPYLSPFCKKSDIPELEKIMNSFYRELRLMRADGTYDKLRKENIELIHSAK